MAPVASDMLARMVEKKRSRSGRVRFDLQIGAIPAGDDRLRLQSDARIAGRDRETLLEFDWKGTGLEKEFGPEGKEKFVPVNYKDDWANTRRIDQVIAEARKASASANRRLRAAGSLAALPQRFVEQHGRGRRDVEAVGHAVHRQAHGRDVRRHARRR